MPLNERLHRYFVRTQSAWHICICQVASMRNTTSHGLVQILFMDRGESVCRENVSTEGEEAGKEAREMLENASYQVVPDISHV